MEISDDLDLDSLVELINYNDEAASDANIDLFSEPSKKDINADKLSQADEVSEKKICKPQTLKDIPLNLFSSEKKEITETPDSLFEKNKSLVHTGETDSSDDENRSYLSESGRNIKKKLAKAINYHHEPQRKILQTWKNMEPSSSKINSVKIFSAPAITKKTQLENKSFITCGYSGIRIVNPLVPFDAMQQRMQDRKMIKMSFIKNFVKNGDIAGDWVTIGVLVNKLPPKTTKQGKMYSIWKMTDLHDCEKIVSVFLFGNTHSEHWKTAVGTVVGILNPSITSEKSKEGEISLSVDHPGKMMMMGTAKDLGQCKSRRKDGESCKMVVNLSQCEYCLYHVKKEYKKFSGQRAELQASFSGREPGFKSKVLKGQNFFYGGQMFVPLGKKPKAAASRDKLTLSNLTLKRKAEALQDDEKDKGVKKLTEMYGPEISNVAETNSEFINNQLAVPSAGSRNLLQHLMKNKNKNEETLQVISQQDLFLMHKRQMNNKPVKSDNQILRNLMPELGKGLTPGQNIRLDVLPRASPKIFNSQEVAKLKAIRKIQEKGPIKKNNPNAIKKPSPVSVDKVKAKLKGLASEKDNELENDKDSCVKEQLSLSKLGIIDLNSKRVQEILNRKSSHSYEIEIDEMEREAKYFNYLEKKEQMEEKMTSITEIACDVVSCKQCKYTAHKAADRCKSENHPLKCHKALKRFFCCKECSNRTWCFTMFPTRACRNCGGSKFERTGMWKVRSGPRLASETLNISSDDALFLNSL